jgi:hypothetical protein
MNGDTEYESVDEFIARGGYIKKGVTKYDFIKSKDKKFIPENYQIYQFYQSEGWSKLKKGFYQKCYLEDIFYCQQCGCTHQKMMRVDHIRSVRYNWDLRLDSDNIQILCFKCNRTKKSSEYKATGVPKCIIGCNKCIVTTKRSRMHEESFCSEDGIIKWLAERNQTEIDEYINSQIRIAEENLKQYYELQRV